MPTCRACYRDRENGRPIPLRPVVRGTDIDIEAKRKRDRERKKALRLDPILGEKLRARQRESQRRYYWRNRQTVLERHRESYAASLDRPVRDGFGRPRVAA